MTDTAISMRELIWTEIRKRHGGDPFLQAMINVPFLAENAGVLGLVCMPRDRFTTRCHYVVLDGELADDRVLVEQYVKHIQGAESCYADLSTGTATDWIVVVACLQ